MFVLLHITTVTLCEIISITPSFDHAISKQNEILPEKGKTRRRNTKNKETNIKQQNKEKRKIKLTNQKKQQQQQQQQHTENKE